MDYQEQASIFVKCFGAVLVGKYGPVHQDSGTNVLTTDSKTMQTC